MNTKISILLSQIDKHCNIIAMCDNVAFVEVDGKHALIEHLDTKIGNNLKYHYLNKYDCNIIFRDFVNQVIYKKEQKLNLSLKD